MSTPPYSPGPDVNYQSATFVNRDDEHVRMLSISWYVWTGLTAFFGTIPVIHLTIGLVMLLHPSSFGHGPGAPPRVHGLDVHLHGRRIRLIGWTGAILSFLTARSLKARRHLLLCQIAAGLACLSMPIGTTLGVFTFIVVTRPSVKATFT